VSDQEITEHKKKIDAMSQFQMARLFRFVPSGHPYFDNAIPLNDYFNKKFEERGGMTPEISKQLGWER